MYGDGSPLPKHVIGTPRHRVLEKTRKSWSHEELVGNCTVTGLKLNARGELVQHCIISNTFGDDCGSLNVTFLYNDVAKPFVDSLSASTSEKCKRIDLQKQYKFQHSLAGKENLYGMPESQARRYSYSKNSLSQSRDHRERLSPPGLTPKNNVYSNYETGHQTQSLHPAGDCEDSDNINSHADAMSDESVIQYLRQLDPATLVG